MGSYGGLRVALRQNDNRLAYEFDGNNSDVNSDVGEMSQQ